MAEENNNHGESNENSIINEQNEYPPNVIRTEPDIGLGGRSHQSEDRKRRSKEGNHSRREDAPISFKHFLQNERGASTSSSASGAEFPDLYRCSRQERQNTNGPSLVDPESPDLPDFVQDHLAMEHLYFNNDAHTASFNIKNLPDFAYAFNSEHGVEIPSEQRYSDIACSRLNDCAQEVRRATTRSRIPLDLPVPSFVADERLPAYGSMLPFDLTTQTSCRAATADVHSPTETERSGAGGRLPDFLSDGHILGHGDRRHREAKIVTSENGSDTEASSSERHHLIIALRKENNKLRDEILILQSILTKKDDRIKELEDLVMALEISKLQMSTDANTQTNKPQTDDELSILKQELDLSKKELLKLKKESKYTASNATYEKCKETKQLNTSLARKMREMTDNSESLVRQLLEVITNMQSEFNTEISSSMSEQEESKNEPDNSGDPSTSSA